MGDARTRGLVMVGLAYVAAAATAYSTATAMGSTHPIWTAFVADVTATLVIFAFSFAFDNSSFYDVYWSVAPLPIVLYWSAVAGAASTDGVARVSAVRRGLVFAVIALWGARLTYNWIRSWTGLAHEDWRYVKLRAQSGSLYWLVSLVGLHLMPTLWVFGGLLPVYSAAAVGTEPLGLLDALATAVGFGAIWIEARADKELVDFRRSNRKPGEILATGLWARSRHPNYFGEMSFWWALFLFGLAADSSYAWTGIGALAITAMFRFASLPMMEERMLERRPHYAEHQRRIPLVVPRLWQ